MTRDELVSTIKTNWDMWLDNSSGKRLSESVADAIIAKCFRVIPTGVVHRLEPGLYINGSNEFVGTCHVLVIKDDTPPCTASEAARRNEQAKFKQWADRLYEIACGMRKEVGDDC